MDGKESTEIKFGEDIEQDEYMLFEMSEDLLQEMKAAPFEIRGKESDKAVMVTQDRTFDIRLAENSNTLLLIPGVPQKTQETQSSTDSRTVTGTVTRFYSLKEIQPRLHTLRFLLSQNLYGGDSEECLTGREEEDDEKERNSAAKNLYTTATLRATVQASDSQLYQSLQDLGAVEIDGFWRLLDPDYAGGIFENILNFAMEFDWDLNALVLSEVAKAMDEECPIAITTHVLRSNSHPPVADQADGVFRLDAKKICLFRATQLFAEKQPFPVDEFLTQWQDIVPYGITTNADYLKGQAIKEKCVPTKTNKSGLQYRYLPLAALSPNPMQRFKELFALKERWSEEDMMLYTRDLPSPEQGHDQFLLGHCRAINTPEGLVYTSRN